MPDERLDDLPLKEGWDDARAAAVNPYLKLHAELGLPVITAEAAPGYAGRWSEAFGRSAPLHVEIGSGNGFFLSGMAALQPDHNWLGFEIRYKRVVLCARKILALGVSNARIARYDAWELADLFGPGQLSGLYVNHPDPWPKERHHKNRLLGPQFMGWAATALMSGGKLRLKTDAISNVDLMLESMAGLPFVMSGRSEDVRALGTPWQGQDDVITNYQRKTYVKGLPVYAVELTRA